MNLPEEAPKLPLLPFLVGDGVLIATAFFIGQNCAVPLGPWPLLAITACVVLGAVLASVPFIFNYGKRQDDELTERQNQIAALARTTSESAQQLSIAAASLHGIAEASSGNLKFIEQLPAQLQDHVKVLQKQLSDTAKSASTSAKDEAVRIDAASERIAKSLADLAKLETTSRQHLAAVNDALGKFSALSEKAAAHAGQQLAEAVTAALAEAKLQALADFELQLSAAVTRAVAQAESPQAEPPRRKRPKPVPEGEAPATGEILSVEAPPQETPPPPPAAPAPTVEEAAPPPATKNPPAVAEAPAQPEPSPAPVLPPATEDTLSTPADPSPEEVPVDEPPAPKPRVRHPKPAADPVPELGLAVESPEAESALSSDGFTRLVATAYIGIGNKLFIRGEGPGLSWDKGVPLQFVSIGKWRWETADATAPVQAKLYKNDQTECTSVGTLTMEPGHQHEVNAGF